MMSVSTSRSIKRPQSGSALIRVPKAIAFCGTGDADDFFRGACEYRSHMWSCTDDLNLPREPSRAVILVIPCTSLIPAEGFTTAGFYSGCRVAKTMRSACS